MSLQSLGLRRSVADVKNCPWWVAVRTWWQFWSGMAYCSSLLLPPRVRRRFWYGDLAG